jgi:DNA-directed RNA polymerase subunit RPC12/RpoP
MKNQTEWTCHECGKGNLTDPSTLKPGAVVQCEACGAYSDAEHLGLVKAAAAARKPAGKKK